MLNLDKLVVEKVPFEKDIWLKIPNVWEYLNYVYLEPEFEKDKAEQGFSIMRINFLLETFFKGKSKNYKQKILVKEGIIEKMHKVITNYDNFKTNEETESKTKNNQQAKIKDVDIVYMISKFSNFYGYKIKEVYEMKIDLFFEMYIRINVIESEKELRMMDLFAIPSYRKTEEGIDYINEMKKHRKETLDTMYEIEIPKVDTIGNIRKIKEYFRKHSEGQLIKNKERE